MKYKIDDKFVMLKEVCTLRKGDIVRFVKQDRNEDLVLLERSDSRRAWCWVGEDTIPINNWSSVEITNCTVNHHEPNTYGDIKYINAIRAGLTKEEFIGFLRGEIIRYTCRMNSNGNLLQDTKNSVWYSNKLISVLEEE